MTKTTDFVISADGTRIAVDRYGAGPALVLVSGATSKRVYRESLAAALASDFAVYAYDRRGRGDSSDTWPYAVEREIEDLAAVIAMAGGSAFVYGHSSGAVLAMRATAAGLPVPKLVVYEPPFVVDDSREPVPANFVETINELVSLGKRDEACIYFGTAVVGMPESMGEEMRKSPFWPGMVEMAHTMAYDGTVMGETMFGNPLQSDPWVNITIPVLALDGGESPVWMHHGVEALVAILPNAQHRRLEGQDHGAADDVLVRELTSFLLD